MINFVKSRTSDGAVLSQKKIADNWWWVYHDTCVTTWAFPPMCYDADGKQVGFWKDNSGKNRDMNPAVAKMVCVDRQRGVTVTLTRC